MLAFRLYTQKNWKFWKEGVAFPIHSLRKLKNIFWGACFLHFYILNKSKKTFYVLISYFFCNVLNWYFSYQKSSLETGCLSNLHLLLRAQASSFLIHPLFKTLSVRPSWIPCQLLYSNCLTYGSPCHAIGYHVFLPNHHLEKQRISLGVASILRMYICPHI